MKGRFHQDPLTGDGAPLNRVRRIWRVKLLPLAAFAFPHWTLANAITRNAGCPGAQGKGVSRHRAGAAYAHRAAVHRHHAGGATGKRPAA